MTEPRGRVRHGRFALVCAIVALLGAPLVLGLVLSKRAHHCDATPRRLTGAQAGADSREPAPRARPAMPATVRAAPHAAPKPDAHSTDVAVRVVAGADVPVVGAVVVAFPSDSGGAEPRGGDVIRALTDADGRTTLPGLVRSLTLGVMAEGFVPHVESVVVPETGAVTAAPLVVRLAPNWSLRCRVTDAVRRTPLDGAFVELRSGGAGGSPALVFPGPESGGAYAGSTTSDAEGECAFESIAAERVTLTCHHFGYANTTRELTRDDAEQVVVIALEASAELVVEMLNWRDGPDRWGRCVVRDADGGALVNEFFTRRFDGNRATFRDRIPVGRFDVVVEVHGLGAGSGTFAVEVPGESVTLALYLNPPAHVVVSPRDGAALRGRIAQRDAAGGLICLIDAVGDTPEFDASPECRTFDFVAEDRVAFGVPVPPGGGIASVDAVTPSRIRNDGATRVRLHCDRADGTRETMYVFDPRGGLACVTECELAPDDVAVLAPRPGVVAVVEAPTRLRFDLDPGRTVRITERGAPR